MHFAVFDYDFDKNDCLGSAVLKGHGMEKKVVWNWIATCSFIIYSIAHTYMIPLMKHDE